MAGAYEEISSRMAVDAPMHPGGFALTDRALDFCELPAGALVLDIGCGTGGTVARMMSRHRLHAFGVDPSFFLLQKGRSLNAPPAVVRAVGEELPFQSSAWDCVVAECSLSVAADPAGVLGESHRLLKEGGRLVLSDLYLRNPAGKPEGCRLPAHGCLKGVLAREELLGYVRAAGFCVLLWEDHSEALKRYAAELLFSCGSADEFRTLFWRGGGDKDGEEFRRVITSTKPGYFLLVAEKRSG